MVLFVLVKFGQNLLLAKFGSERVKRKSDEHRMIGWWFKNCFNEGLRLSPARWELPIMDYTGKLRPKGVTFLGRDFT